VPDVHWTALSPTIALLYLAGWMGVSLIVVAFTTAR
jgi:hypothetical protein